MAEGAVFDVSKLTVFEVSVLENVEYSHTADRKQSLVTTQPQNDPQNLKELIRQNPNISRKQIAAKLNISVSTVKRLLNDLGIFWEGNPKTGHWTFGTSNDPQNLKWGEDEIGWGRSP